MMKGGNEGLIRLVIPRIPPSNNELLRMHWHKQRQLTKTWEQEIMVARVEQLDEVPEPAGPKLKKVYFIIHRPGFIKDKDNLHGGMKPVLDALKKQRLIYDDSTKYCEYIVIQKPDLERKPRTEIFIFPADLI